MEATQGTQTWKALAKRLSLDLRERIQVAYGISIVNDCWELPAFNGWAEEAQKLVVLDEGAREERWETAPPSGAAEGQGGRRPKEAHRPNLIHTQLSSHLTVFVPFLYRLFISSSCNILDEIFIPETFLNPVQLWLPHAHHSVEIDPTNVTSAIY